MKWMLAISIVLLAAGPTLSQNDARRRSSSSAEIATLKEQLESGLRARRPQEFAFVQRVVRQVEQGELPRKLVKSTFQWARRKRPYPYPFFERALKIRAARIGITVR